MGVVELDTVSAEGVGPVLPPLVDASLTDVELAQGGGFQGETEGTRVPLEKLVGSHTDFLTWEETKTKTH